MLEKFPGTLLEGLKCRHPLYERDSLLLLAPYVTLDAGTGCVHTAPGHGQEDYESGVQYGLDIYSPVDDDGRFTTDVPVFAGQFVFDANGAVNRKLTEVGALLKGGDDVALLPPLLADERSDHLPCHGAVVHLHGEERICGRRPSSRSTGSAGFLPGEGTGSTA